MNSTGPNPSRLLTLPPERSSSTATCEPNSKSAWARCEPMNPAPPVTKARLPRNESPCMVCHFVWSSIFVSLCSELLRLPDQLMIQGVNHCTRPAGFGSLNKIIRFACRDVMKMKSRVLGRRSRQRLVELNHRLAKQDGLILLRRPMRMQLHEKPVRPRRQLNRSPKPKIQSAFAG